jgi:hypothetical protein
MAALPALVIVMMLVGMRGMVVVMMAVPVAMPMAVTLVFGVVTAVITSSGHKHLEVFRTVGMVIVLAEGPVIQPRFVAVAGRHLRHLVHERSLPASGSCHGHARQWAANCCIVRASLCMS